ncbi:helix-turn-helix domain-containing protein [Microbacterium sp.]|uniref:MarR family transcriptional regulator n=1 Tax=Microbacterium sp. TaxID=51671 RepID=UPI001ACD62EF|nr:helix-turn-helix domain-containing protein [Microbacterium sp.]MBN9180270.1 MarR family transcriptional regulator [Microbacterium sp.]MBN9185460.1 MarR family transcriptional regulator [Microbacterium sp.]MBN9187387.1 MarR family transcriptional regulator [Microbacterium sp.]MBN9193545.1 MarR family transcriptional regulator [Microbacterium sp.]
MPAQNAAHPEHDLSPDVVRDRLPDALDHESFTPRLLALLTYELVWRESHELRRLFGLGTNEWRILSALASLPGASATEVSEFLDVNKAIVSKSAATLVSRQLIVLSDGPRGSRPMHMTAAGAAMHAAMRPISVRGQEIILAGMSDAEIETFNANIHRMLAALRAADADADPGADDLGDIQDDVEA